MGTARLDSIHDYTARKVDLGVRCRGCWRVVVYDSEEVRLYLQARFARTNRLEPFPRLRCRCGSIDLRFHPVQRTFRPDPLPERLPVLRPIYEAG